MSDEFSKTESMLSIAEDIEELSSYLPQQDRLDVKTALSCIELYKSTFGDEGFTFLDNKVNSFMIKYGFEKPDETGIKEIKNFTEKLITLKTHQFHNYQDQKNYNSFIESEKAEIAKLPKQGEKTDRRSVENINSKEKIMSDEFEDTEKEIIEELKELSPKQQAYIKAANEARYERKVIAEAIYAGTLACLPGADGYADTTPARNIMNSDNKNYHGVNLLLIKEHQNQKQNDFPTGEYLTAFQIDEAIKGKPDLFIRKGQHGITIHVNEKNDQTGEWEEKNIKLFNVAQLNKPDVIKNWAEQKKQEKEQERFEYNQTRYGTGYTPPETKTREPGPEIVCSSTEPEKYLGQYLAAVSMGSKFKVSSEQAAEFSKKMIDSMYEKMEPRVNKETGEIIQPPMNKETHEPITNPFKLAKISNAANKECQAFMRDLRIEAQKQNQQQEQKQEQTQSRGRGM